jgi:hypothetical protein
MMRTTLLAGSAVWILAATPALADGMGDKKVTGFGDIGYMYNDYEVDGLGDFDSRTIHAKGSVLWDLQGEWNVQGNFGFNSEKVEVPPVDFAIDTWHLGVGAFWRGKQGAFGGEINYQAIDVALSVEGYNARLRGEYFLPHITLGGGIGYNTFDDNGVDVDGWDFGLYGRFYAQPQLALTLSGAYNTWEDNTAIAFLGDVDGWFGRAEAEYLIPNCVTSVYGAFEYGSYDIANVDTDFWSLGIGFRFYLNTDGDLETRHRTGPYDMVEFNPRLTF